MSDKGSRPSQSLFGSLRKGAEAPAAGAPGQDADTVERLTAIATEVRAFLEPRWTRGLSYATPPPTPSAQQCVLSSRFLEQVLKQQGHDAKFQAGTDTGEGFLVAGVRQGHSWVLADGMIVDITGDQFKAPPVIVTPGDDPRYARSSAGFKMLDSDKRDVAALWEEWQTEHAGARPAPSAPKPKLPKPG